MNPVPMPTEGDVPVNDPAKVEIAPGERATVTFTTKNRVSELILPVVAISKYPDCVYVVKADARDRYGPAPIPPTDVDDLEVTFLPALKFSDSLTVQVTNLGSVNRVINVQPIGWEPQGEENGS